MSLLRPLAVATFLIGAAARGVAAQHDLVTLPLHDPAYRQLDGLSRQGCAAARVSPYRPYPMRSVRDAVARMADDERCEGTLAASLRDRFGARAVADTTAGFRFGASVEAMGTALRNGEFRPLWRDVRATGDGTPSAVGIARARVSWNAAPYLVAVTEAYAQTETRNDPANRALPLRQGSGALDFSEAYLNGRIGPLVLSFGRAREAWLGRGTESLVLSASGPAIDRLSALARWSRVEARAIVASLDRVALDPVRDGPDVGLTPTTVYRMLAGHALTYRPTPSWELTLGETVLIGRRSPTPDFAYANPLMLFLVTEHDADRVADGTQNNIYVFGAVRYARGPAAIDAELVVDDIQIDRPDREVTPDQLAWRLAATTGLGLPLPSSVGVEYRRVDSYTYLRKTYNVVYQHYGSPVGSELGPDADWLEAEADVWPSGELRLAASVARWRRGAQRIEARPSQGAEGHAGEPFPSATAARPEAQRALVLALSAEHLGALLPVTVRGEVARMDNVNNRPDTPATYARVSIVASYRFRYP